jgi:hypothetical protein
MIRKRIGEAKSNILIFKEDAPKKGFIVFGIIEEKTSLHNPVDE